MQLEDESARLEEKWRGSVGWKREWASEFSVGERGATMGKEIWYMTLREVSVFDLGEGEGERARV